MHLSANKMASVVKGDGLKTEWIDAFRARASDSSSTAMHTNVHTHANTSART